MRFVKKLTLFLILFLITFPTLISAETSNQVKIDTILRLDQLIEESTSYHAILVKEDKETFEYVIKNNTDKQVEILITPLNAITTKNGQGVYLNDIDIHDYYTDSNFALADNVIVPEKIIVEANSEKIIEAIVTVPPFEKGEMTLALGFQQLNKNEEEKQSEGFNIKTETVFVSGILLQKEKKDEINLSFDGQVDVEKNNNNGVSLVYPIQNNSAKIIKDIKGNVIVLDKNGNEIINEQINMNRFYPKNKIGVEVFWNGLLKEGIYDVILEIEIDGKSFGDKKEIKVSDDTLKSLEENEEDKTTTIKKEQKTSFILILIIILSIIVILLFIFIIILLKKQKKDKKKDEEENEGENKGEEIDEKEN